VDWRAGAGVWGGGGCTKRAGIFVAWLLLLRAWGVAAGLVRASRAECAACWKLRWGPVAGPCKRAVCVCVCRLLAGLAEGLPCGRPARG
jgi:hypothetical protein